MKKVVLLIIGACLCLLLVACRTSEMEKHYNITFCVGEQSYTTEVKEGETPVFFGTTERASDERFTYRFDGWDRAFVPATEDAVYTATYTAISRERDTVTVTFVVGAELTRVETVVGELPIFPGTTDRADEDGISFAFDGWDKEIAPAYTNDTYIAKYIEGCASYPVEFVLFGDCVAHFEVKHGELATMPDESGYTVPEGYDGVLWLGADKPIHSAVQIVGYPFFGSPELARRALSARSVEEGGDITEAVSSLLYIAFYGSEPMMSFATAHLRSLSAVEAESLTAHDSALLFVALSLLPEAMLDEYRAELVSLTETLALRGMSEENASLRLITTVFASRYFGEDAFDALCADKKFSYEGFSVSTPEALLEKAFLLTYSRPVRNGYSLYGVSYAYIRDNTASPYVGEVGMLLAMDADGCSDASRAGADMAVMSAALLASRTLGICDFREQRESVFAKVFVGNADLMYKLSHGYYSFDGEKQRISTEDNVPVSYLYMKQLYLESYGDLTLGDMTRAENITSAEYLVSAGANKADNLTITLSEKADAIVGDGNYYSGSDFLLEFSVLADDSTANAEYRIRLYGGTVTCIANIKGTQFVPKSGVLTPLDNAPSSFNLGEYGWHRFGMRFSQKTDLVNGEVSYCLLFTFYLDGEKIGVYEADSALFVENGYLLHTASVKDGELSYGAPNRIYFQMYKRLFYNTDNTAYFFYLKDVITSAGEDFVRRVKPLTLETGEGAFGERELSVEPSEFAPSSYAVSDTQYYYLVDEYAILPSPTLAGHRFTGWYADTALRERIDAISPMKDTPRILYAAYEKVATRVLLESGGLLNETYMYLPYDEGAHTLPTASIGFFRLVGWYLDRECTVTQTQGVRIEDGVLYTDGRVEDGLVLYARFEEFRPEGSVQVSYSLPFSDIVLPDGVITRLLREQIGSTVVLPELVAPKGWRFDGWYMNEAYEGESLLTLVFTEQMSDAGVDIMLYAHFVPVAVASAESTTPADNPNMFYAILQSKGEATVNLAARPYICYEFDYTAGMATKSMNFALHSGSGNQLMFFDLDTKGNITLNTMVYTEKLKIASLTEGEYRVAIVLEQGDIVTRADDGSYTVKYYFDMTLYIDGEKTGTWRTKEDAVFVTDACNYLFYEVIADESGEPSRATVVHENDHLRVRMRTTSSGKMTGVSSFINDCYLFNTKTPVYENTVEKENG